MEINGTIIEIFETQTFESGFTKREFVIETPGEYPQQIKFEVLKDKCELLDKYKIGQNVDVTFDIKGREYNGRYFNNLIAWKVFSNDKVEAVTKGHPATQEPVEYKGSAPMDNGSEQGDLPF